MKESENRAKVGVWAQQGGEHDQVRGRVESTSMKSGHQGWTSEACWKNVDFFSEWNPIGGF